MDAVELRAARPVDAGPIEDYHHRCFLSTYAAHLAAGSFGPPDRAGTRQQLHDWFVPGSDCETVVAVDGGTPVGHVTVSRHRLVHLFVEPGHQGRGPGPAPARPGRGDAHRSAPRRVSVARNCRRSNVCSMHGGDRARGRS